MRADFRHNSGPSQQVSLSCSWTVNNHLKQPCFGGHLLCADLLTKMQNFGTLGMSPRLISPHLVGKSYTLASPSSIVILLVLVNTVYLSIHHEMLLTFVVLFWRTLLKTPYSECGIPAWLITIACMESSKSLTHQIEDLLTRWLYRRIHPVVT